MLVRRIFAFGLALTLVVSVSALVTCTDVPRGGVDIPLRSGMSRLDLYICNKTGEVADDVVVEISCQSPSVTVPKITEVIGFEGDLVDDNGNGKLDKGEKDTKPSPPSHKCRVIFSKESLRAGGCQDLKVRLDGEVPAGCQLAVYLSAKDSTGLHWDMVGLPGTPGPSGLCYAALEVGGEAQLLGASVPQADIAWLWPTANWRVLSESSPSLGTVARVLLPWQGALIPLAEGGISVMDYPMATPTDWAPETDPGFAVTEGELELLYSHLGLGFRIANSCGRILPDVHVDVAVGAGQHSYVLSPVATDVGGEMELDALESLSATITRCYVQVSVGGAIRIGARVALRASAFTRVLGESSRTPAAHVQAGGSLSIGIEF